MCPVMSRVYPVSHSVTVWADFLLNNKYFNSIIRDCKVHFFVNLTTFPTVEVKYRAYPTNVGLLKPNSLGVANADAASAVFTRHRRCGLCLLNVGLMRVFPW